MSRARGLRRGAGAAALAAAIALCGCGGPVEQGEGDRQGAGDSAATTPPAGETAGVVKPIEAPPPVVEENRITVTLYYSDADGELTPERRDLAIEPQRHEQARLVMEALLQGPRTRLTRVIPNDTTLRALYLQPDGTAYVDLDAAFARGLSHGSEDALLAVRAITDTLAVNFPEVRRVKILVDGQEVKALGGHLDLSRPLAPDPFVGRSARAALAAPPAAP